MFDVAKAERCPVEVMRVVALAEAVLMRNKQAVFCSPTAEDGLTLDEMAKHWQEGGALYIKNGVPGNVTLTLSAEAANTLCNLLGKGITGPSFNHLKVLQPRGYSDAIVAALRGVGCEYDSAITNDGLTFFNEVVNG